MSATRVLAHRGRGGEWPENSLLGFGKAVELGADGIECDLQKSADGHIIIIHDSSLERTTTGRGDARELTLAQLRRLRLRGADGSDQTIPTLDEMLELFKPTDMHLRLEIKQSGIERDVIDKLKGVGLDGQAIISSFKSSAARAVKQADGRIPTSLITGNLAESDYDKVVDCLDMLDFAKPWSATPEAVAQVRNDGLAITIGTVNTKEAFDQVIGFDPQYITTDRPALIMRLLGRDVPDWAEPDD